MDAVSRLRLIASGLAYALPRGAAILTLAACAAGSGQPAPTSNAAAAAVDARKPNIVLILADDLGYESLGCAGGESYATPNVDRLAAQGLRFENAFCTPLCTPTRVMLMTGRYGFRTGQTWGVLPPTETTFAHVLQKAGYATAVAGKWQLAHFQEDPGHATRAGFDAHCLWTWSWNGRRPSRYWNPSIWQDGKLLAGAEKKYGPDIYCDYLVDFIRKNKDRPFFVYYPMALVHAPVEPTPDHPDRKPGPERYADTVAYMDKLVGRVVSALDELGLRESTLILFSGDNGTASGVTSRFRGRPFPGGKGTVTDAGSHVPLVANWPGVVPAGRVTGALADLSDVFPTLAELAGAKAPEGVRIDGRSLVPILKGAERGPRDWVYVQLWEQYCVRDRRWALHEDGRLCDAATDPQEARPVAPGADAEADAARARLQEALDRLRKDPDWKPVRRGKGAE